MVDTLPPVESARCVPILVNPHAGTGQAPHLLRELLRQLKANGMSPVLCRQREELNALADSAQRERIRCVISAGGDGTLLEVLNRAPGLPVAILPLGNENLVARYCGIRRSGLMVAEMVQRGRLRTTDLARAGNRLFSLMAGIGFDADVVHRVHQRRKGHINKLSWIVPILQSLTHYDYPLVDIEIEDTGERLAAAMLFVINLPGYAMDLPLARDAVPDDGQLDLCIFPQPGRLNLARYLLAVLRGRQAQLPDFQRRLVRSVQLSARQKVPVQTDGDPAGQLPLRIESVPAAMTLVVP